MVLTCNTPPIQGRTRTSERALQSTSSKPRGDLVSLSRPDRTYCHIGRCAAFILPEHTSDTIGTCPSCHVKTCVVCKGPEHSSKCSSRSGCQDFLSDYSPVGHATLPDQGSINNHDVTLHHLRSFDRGSHMYQETRNGRTVSRRIPGTLTENECARYLQYKNRARKDKGKDGKEIWPDYLEEAFQIALRCVPPMGKYKTPLTCKGGVKKPSGRNELIARKIEMLTGVTRLRKQISSHIQVLKGMIKNPEWLQFVETPPQNDQEARKRNFHFDENSGEVVFHDNSTHEHEHKSERDDLLPPCHTLGSSVPPQHTSVNKIELEMSVYPPSSEHNEELQACHTYTRIQSEIGSQPKMLEDNVFWRELYPDLHCKDDRLPQGEILMLEANLELMKTFSPKHSRLGIHLYADISCDKAFLSWNFRTRFYDKGRLCKENAGKLGSNRIADSSKTRVEISLFSSWWVQMFQEILERRHLIDLSGDLAALQQHEDSTRKDIRGLSIMQEIFASSEHSSSLDPLTSKPAITLLWKFRQTRPGEAATTSWRKLCPPPLHIPTNSPMPKVPQPPMALDTDSQPYCDQAKSPLPGAQLSQTEAFQSTLSWEQWAHTPRNAYSEQTGNMLMEAESPHPSAPNCYPEYPPYQAALDPAENCEENSRFHLVPYQSDVQTTYRPINHPLENSFATYGTHQQLYDFVNHPSAANPDIDCSNLFTASNYSSQSTAGDYMSQSTAATSIFQSTGTDIASQSTTDYSQDTSDHNIDEIASCNIELDFKHIQVEDPLQNGYGNLTLAAPVIEMGSAHQQKAPDPYQQEYQQQQELYYSHGHQTHQHLHQAFYGGTLDLQAYVAETHNVIGERVSNDAASQSYMIHHNEHGMVLNETMDAEIDLHPKPNGDSLSFEEWQKMEDNQDIAKSLVWLKQNASQMEHLYEIYHGDRNRMRAAHTEYMNAMFGHGNQTDVPHEENASEEPQVQRYDDGGDGHVLGVVVDREEAGGDPGDGAA